MLQLTQDQLGSDRTKPILIIKIMLFSASLIPSLVAGALAWYNGYFSWTPFLMATLGLLLGQTGGDYLYYYFTDMHTDTRDAHTKIFAGWKPFFAGSVLNKTGILITGIVCLVIDIFIAWYFYQQLGTTIFILALLGGLIAIFFTPLMYRGYKEPVIFVTFGPLSVIGVYFVLSGNLLIDALMVSLPIGFLVTVVAYLKGARYRISEDAQKNAVFSIKKNWMVWLFILAYLSNIAGVVFGFMPVYSLLGLLTIPLALNIVSVVNQKSGKVSQYLWATVKSIVVLVASGILIAIGLVIG